MTYSLAVSNGDLVVKGSQLGIVSGTQKLSQDLQIWLYSRFGSDMMHPTFGSVLESWIGGVIQKSTQANVYNEVLRVLNNYQSMQYQLFQASPQLFSVAELLYSIDNVDVSITYDTVYVTIQVSNPSSTAVVTIAASSL